MVKNSACAMAAKDFSKIIIHYKDLYTDQAYNIQASYEENFCHCWRNKSEDSKGEPWLFVLI